MNWISQLTARLPAPKLTNKRIFAAITVALIADALQILLLPLAWTFSESAVDVTAMLLVMWLIGFHFLLLPTFAIEFIPVMDSFPTWTACVITVIFLHRKQPPPKPPSHLPPTQPD